MDLSRSIVRDFVEITNDSDTSKPDTTVYGTIVEYNGQTYAQIDGADSDILTPISATVDVKTGERVLVTIKNHTATVTGNLDDPSAGRWRVDELGNMIFESVVTFESLENGTTVINGGCIKTGKIEAQYLNLTGAITFGDLDAETQAKVNASGISASEARTIITSTLVSSPNIAGARYYNLGQKTWIEVGKDANGIDNDAYALSLFNLNHGNTPIFSVYNGDFGYTGISGKNGFIFMLVDGEKSTVSPLGTWDFSNAKVEHLSASSTATFA